MQTKGEVDCDLYEVGPQLFIQCEGKGPIAPFKQSKLAPIMH